MSAPREQYLIIPGTLPSLNDLLDRKARMSRSAGRGGTRGNAYNDIKGQWKDNIKIYCLQQQVKPVGRARFRFVWVEATRRRDPDNIAAGGRKLILDGLVSAGILDSDGWKGVLGWEDTFIVDPSRQGVEITIIQS